MPELPEVETVRATLANRIIGNKIIDTTVLCSRIIMPLDGMTFAQKLYNQTIKDIKRYGKYLIFIFDDVSLISHLRMEGKYFIKTIDDEIVKHEHIIFTFENGMSLRYHDTRKFGTMMLVDKTNLKDIMKVPSLAKLGKEANDESFTKEELYKKLAHNNAPIKTALLDQSIICGLGNIYVNEVLFLCHINPFTKSFYLTKEDCQNILTNSIKVLNEAILAGGTTIRSYTSSLGVTGRFQQNLFVHTKEGELCEVCQTKIIKDYCGGRGTYICPTCQKRSSLVVGITGSIATGKSSVSAYLKSLNYEVIDTDLISKDLTMYNIEVLKKIEKTFGSSFIENGILNRKKLGNLIFNNPEERTKLNNILHPLIKIKVKELIKNSQNKIIFVDVPLLFESKFDEIVSYVICVSTDKTTQINRLMMRDNIEYEDAIIKINSQMSLEEKCKKSHFIIDNSRDLCYTYKQIDKVLQKLNKMIGE